MAKLGRPWSVATLLVVAFWLLASLTQSQEAYAGGKKFSGTGKLVAILAETKMFPGDNPGHQVTLTRLQEVDYSSEPGFEEVRVSAVSFSDLTAGTGSHRGYRVGTHANGERTFMGFEGITKTVMKPNGSPETTFEGKWWYTAGTGKFKGIKGSGTYNGKVTKAGFTYEWDGEYELAM